MDGQAIRRPTYREGHPMLFLLRMAFWLTLIVMILPTDGEKPSAVYDTAEAAMKDMSEFCTRKPEACEKGREALGELGEKAQAGMTMLFELVAGYNDSEGGKPAAPAPVALEPKPAAPAPKAEPAMGPSANRDGSSHTLTGDDLQPRWGITDLASGV